MRTIAPVASSRTFTAPAGARLLRLSDSPASRPQDTNAIVAPSWPASLPAWHCASALSGALEGQPTRMQSCGQRPAARIGVIQMSPKRSLGPWRPDDESSRGRASLSGQESTRRRARDTRDRRRAGLGGRARTPEAVMLTRSLLRGTSRRVASDRWVIAPQGTGRWTPSQRDSRWWHRLPGPL
jgi:hypothetical protein